MNKILQVQQDFADLVLRKSIALGKNKPKRTNKKVYGIKVAIKITFLVLKLKKKDKIKNNLIKKEIN